MSSSKNIQKSWRIEDYFDKNLEYELLLFAMQGFYSETFDPSLDQATIAERFSHPEWSERIKDLLYISSLYRQLEDIGQQFSIELNEFLSVIGQTIKDFLNKTYLKDLTEIEQSQKNIAIFNILLKYKQIFQSILDLLSKIDGNNECNILSRLRELLQSKWGFEEANKRTDVFLQMSAQYMLTGKISPLSSSSFFITHSGKDEMTIDYKKWPETVNYRNALVIHETGEFVRTLRSLGVIHDLDENAIFGDSLINNGELYRYPILFDDFLKNVQKHIRLGHLKDFNKQTLSDVLSNFYLFSLHQHEYFWFNLLDQRQMFLRQYPGEENSTKLNKIFRKTLYLTYGFEDAKNFEENIKLITNSSPQSKDEPILMKLNFELPPLAQLWLHRSHKKKYQTIFVYLTKLLQTRYAIMYAWKEKSKLVAQKSRMFLLHWCCKTLASFYSYSKFCILYRMELFAKGCNTTMNIEEISEYHETILIQLSDDLYLNSKMYTNLINDIISFSWRLIKLDCDTIEQSIIDRFKCIRGTVQKLFKDNCDHHSRNRFPELLRFD